MPHSRYDNIASHLGVQATTFTETHYEKIKRIQCQWGEYIRNLQGRHNVENEPMVKILSTVTGYLMVPDANWDYLLHKDMVRILQEYLTLNYI